MLGKEKDGELLLVNLTEEFEELVAKKKQQVSRSKWKLLEKIGIIYYVYFQKLTHL